MQHRVAPPYVSAAKASRKAIARWERNRCEATAKPPRSYRETGAKQDRKKIEKFVIWKKSYIFAGMELLLKRIARKSTYTIGNLSIDGKIVCDTLEDADLWLTQGMPLIEIERRKVSGKTAIPIGKYAVTLEWSPKFSPRHNGRRMPLLHDVPGFTGILIHCLHPDMEILTEKGWLNMAGFAEKNPQKCWSLNMSTNKMELVPIDKVIIEKYIGELYCCEYPLGNYNNASYRVTSEHKMLCEIPLAYGRERRLIKAKDIPIGSSFIACGNTAIETGVDAETLVMCKICMHIVADGYVRWYNTKGGERSSISFHYKKERKINRVLSLLHESKLRYSVSKNKDGSTTIRILYPDCDSIANIVDPEHLGKDGKCIPYSFTMLPKEQMIELIEEYHFADGKYSNMKKETFEYIICSTNVDTLNKIQTMAFLSGYSSSMSHSRFGNDIWKDGYVLCIKKDKPTRTPAASYYVKKPYNGDVFCVQNRNHTIVVRNSLCDVPFIVGNCGNTVEDTSGCILVGKNTGKGVLTDSRATFQALLPLLEAADERGERITITVV